MEQRGRAGLRNSNKYRSDPIATQSCNGTGRAEPPSAPESFGHEAQFQGSQFFDLLLFERMSADSIQRECEDSLPCFRPRRRAPVIHRKLWRDEFGVDVTVAVFNKSGVGGSKL